MLAHYDRKTGREQLLVDHLLNVALDAKAHGEVIEQGHVLFLLGLYHDLGKSDRAFQKMMIGQTRDKVDHSSAGAKYLFDEMRQALVDYPDIEKRNRYASSFSESICYVISAHHGVYDIPLKEKEPTLGNSRLFRRLLYENYSEKSKYHYNLDVLPFAEGLKKIIEVELKMNLKTLITRAFEEYIEMFQKLKWENKKERAFYETLAIRLYLSLLKNADILDTVNSYETLVAPMGEEDYEKLSQQYLSSIEKLYDGYKQPTNELNRVRTNLAEEIRTRGISDQPGIYRLDLPTGAGKTKLSMRYGFHQLKEQKKKRFIYITPYLSVLEQNAAEIRKVVGEDTAGVLEHHSNVIDAEQDTSDEKAQVMRNYLVDTWDYPIILSSMVQLFQTFYKNKSSNIRRFSHLINSVLILDEVQSLPIDVTTLFNLTVNFLNQAMNASVILCTATQPVYHSKYIKHKIQYGNQHQELIDLVKLTSEEQKIFKRTEIHKFKEDDTYSTLQEVATAVESYSKESVLIILNTKAAVKELYELLSVQTNRPCYHLSTNMCAKHRLDRIKEIREKIQEEPLICISTQLIEAGVDLDFNRVIRSYTGIDSIVQASGRCNREGKLDKGIVQLVKVDPEQENLKSKALKSIRDKKEVTEKIIAKLDSPISIELLNDEFFERYYANTEEKYFDYILKKDQPTVFDFLSTNQEQDLSPKVCLRQSFKTAGLEMDLIQNETKGVIVYYGDNDQKIEELIETIRRFEVYYKIEDLEKVKKLVKELQTYTINIHDTSVLQKGVMTFQNGYIQVLQKEHYDYDVGAIEETVFIL
ncbi:CRISPR-associated helicase Cas3' [Enterococcus sp. LJL98]